MRPGTISSYVAPRSDLGPPDQGFVFCCFNQTFKIAAPIFDVWMRLLARVPGSVLWLSEMSDLAQSNLRREAAARGVDPDRLIFAPRMDSSADHLARHRAADLFLDTLPYNAHSTTCDALWAGLPVVTCTGAFFSGRVAASMLKAAGLPELVTSNLDDYEALALKLATDPALLQSIQPQARATTGRPAGCSTATVSAATSRRPMRRCGTSIGAARARATSASSRAHRRRR